MPIFGNATFPPCLQTIILFFIPAETILFPGENYKIWLNIFVVVKNVLTPNLKCYSQVENILLLVEIRKKKKQCGKNIPGWKTLILIANILLTVENILMPAENIKNSFKIYYFRLKVSLS